jgi:hypothetical protein
MHARSCLQNWWTARCVVDGFDSHPPPLTRQNTTGAVVRTAPHNEEHRSARAFGLKAPSLSLARAVRLQALTVINRLPNVVKPPLDAYRGVKDDPSG